MGIHIGKMAALGLAAGLAGCASDSIVAPVASPAVSAAPSSAPYQALPSDGLIGRWGVASFRDAKDRARTTNMAKAQCKNAYVITKGPTDGVMMHVADDTKLYELALKKAGDGKTYLGFATPPGDPQDREVLSISAQEMIMRFVDPDVNTRYGTFVSVRC